MVIGYAMLKTELFFRDKPVDADFLRDITADLKTLDDVTDAVSATAVEWHLRVNGENHVYASFYDFAYACSAYAVKVCFVFDGANFFHYADVARLYLHPNTWERLTAERGDNGVYKGRGKEGFMERSGDNGMRYSVTYWTRSRMINGNRHIRLRSTKFINLDNVIPCGYADACATFGADSDDYLQNVEKIVNEFNEKIKGYGYEWIGEKAVNGETVGAIAKSLLLSFVGGKKHVKNACLLFPSQFKYLNRARLMRGGINICTANNDETIYGVYGYDVNSEYLHVAASMPELGEILRSNIDEYEADDSEKYTYIIVFDDLCVDLNDGQLPILKGRDGEQVYGGICATPAEKLAFFGEELDEIQRAYTITHAHIHAVLRAERRHNDGYKKFADFFYGEKLAAQKRNDSGARYCAKMIINSALGKLAQRSVYGVTTHEKYAQINGFVHAVTVAPNADELDAETGALSFVQGAYVTALARVYWCKTVRAICGERPAATFLYGDTDSVYATRPAPAQLVGQGLGQLKTECENGYGRFFEPKLYGYTDGTRGDIHIAGTRRDDFLRESYRRTGRDGIDAAISCIRADMRVRTTINIIVPYGRASVYRWRSLDGGFDENFAADGRAFGRGKTGLTEF